MSGYPALALFGAHLGYSLSPLIHHAFGEAFAIPLQYHLKECAPHSFPLEFKNFLAEADSVGANITVPFKEAAVLHCDALTEAAKRAGVINTVFKNQTKWIGDNTDGQGFLNALSQHHWPLSYSRILLLGSGGVARGILSVLSILQVREVFLANRTIARAQAVKEFFKSDLNITLIELDEIATLPPVDLVINALAVSPTFIHALLQLPSSVYFFDCNYGSKAAYTALRGNTCDGAWMLVEQAALAFARWFGRAPDALLKAAAFKRIIT